MTVSLQRRDLIGWLAHFVLFHLLSLCYLGRALEYALPFKAGAELSVRLTLAVCVCADVHRVIGQGMVPSRSLLQALDSHCEQSGT
jgi:hypothetical protein